MNDVSVEQSSKNVLVELGLTAEQRSAEIVAGIRAVTFPSAEADALTSPTGRAFAKFLADLSGTLPIRNATGGRHLCMTRLAEQILAEKRHPKRVVELACGFSARGLKLARAFPDTEIVEVDLPNVLVTKQERVHAILNGQTPENLTWKAADLSKTAIQDLLGPNSVDLLICEGMLPYFTPKDISGIAQSAYGCLSRFGVLIADMVNAQGWNMVENTSKMGTWILHKQAGKFKGKFAHEDEPRQLFEQAGYAEVSAMHLQTVAEEILPGTEVADVSFIVIARKD